MSVAYSLSESHERVRLGFTDATCFARHAAALRKMTAGLVASPLPSEPVTREGAGSPWAEVEGALTRRSIDGALLAAEDVPLDVPPDLTLAAVLPRGPVEDALITRAARTLQQLPLKARVLTSGARRRAALLQARPDLTLIERRVSLPDTPALLNAEDVDAAVVPSSDTAGASLSGFGLQLLPATVFTPAAGQGAFVIVARADDEIRLTTFATLDDADARLLICAERAVMKALGAAASAPVGVLAQLRGRRLEMSGKVWSPDGRDCAGATIAGDVLEDSRLALELAYELSLRGAASLLALDKLHRAA